MKNIFATCLVAAVSCSTVAYAEVIHCDATYKNKPFVQVTIWSGMNGFGNAECDYKNPQDSEVIKYDLPSQNEYYKVAGNWRSTMPGYQWCSVEDGNQFNTCLIAKRETGLR